MCRHVLGITKEYLEVDDDFTLVLSTSVAALYLLVLIGFCKRTYGGRYEKTNGWRLCAVTFGDQCVGRGRTPDDESSNV